MHERSFDSELSTSSSPVTLWVRFFIFKFGTQIAKLGFVVFKSQFIWILATHDDVGHLRYSRSVTLTSYVTPTMSDVVRRIVHTISYVRYSGNRPTTS
jgi:hypothetical protein